MGELNAQDLHDFRKEIDANIKKCEGFKNLGGSAGRELSLAYTKLQESKMWVGKALEAIGSELPQEYRDEAEQPADEEKSAE